MGIENTPAPFSQHRALVVLIRPQAHHQLEG